jgi:hypothetical protein
MSKQKESHLIFIYAETTAILIRDQTEKLRKQEISKLNPEYQRLNSILVDTFLKLNKLSFDLIDLTEPRNPNL